MRSYERYKESPKRYKPSTALWISIVWGLIPLNEYLPVDSLPHLLHDALFTVCFPGWLLALFFCGGVHGEYMDAAPILCAVFTALITFGAISLLFKFLRRRAA